MADNIELEKKKIQEEKKKLKREQDAQRKEAKKKAKALARQEAELDDSGSGFSTFMVTLFIILIWIFVKNKIIHKIIVKYREMTI